MQAEDKNWIAGRFLEAAYVGVGIELRGAVKRETGILVGRTWKEESGVSKELTESMIKLNWKADVIF